MFDILLFLFENYFDIGNYPDINRLTAKLSAAGFEEDDITQAIAWLSGLQQLTTISYPEKINQGGLRCYTNFECRRISDEGLSFIVFLEQNKMISPVEREMIIDRVVALDREYLALDKVKLITLIVLWNQHEDLDPMLIEDLLTPSAVASYH